jgi:tetratricopeptide (TPR) repeat protein
MGNLEKVSEVLDDLEAKVLELSRIYHHVGDLCLNAGLTMEAIKFYRKFIFLNPSVSSAKEVCEKVNALAAHIDDSPAGMDANAYNHTDRVASDFCTTTLAELYIRQGHLDMALNVLGEILKREPENRLVADRLNDVMAIQRDGIREKRFSHIIEQDEAVIKELARWLENVVRLRSHAS